MVHHMLEELLGPMLAELVEQQAADTLLGVSTMVADIVPRGGWEEVVGMGTCTPQDRAV
jgi:hypothetical protein